MSICRARLRNTSNGLTFRMSGEQIRLLYVCKSSPTNFLHFRAAHSYNDITRPT